MVAISEDLLPTRNLAAPPWERVRVNVLLRKARKQVSDTRVTRDGKCITLHT